MHKTVNNKSFIVTNKTGSDYVVAPRGYYWTASGVKKEPGKVVGCVEWGPIEHAYRFDTLRKAAHVARGCGGFIKQTN